MTLTFNEYQNLTATTAIYPGSGEGGWAALSYVGLGVGEVGEIQGKLKKVARDDGGAVTPERREDLLAEAGDVLWYVSQLCTELDATLEDVAASNINKLSSRKERGVITGSGDNR